MDKEFPAIGPDALKILHTIIEEEFVKKEEGKGLSENNFTAAAAHKLENLTKNYDELDNLPTINGFTLSGECSFENLGMAIEIQRMLDAMKPGINSGESTAFNESIFGEGTIVRWDVTGRMCTVRMTINIPMKEVSPIENHTPQLVLTETLPPAVDEHWEHLGRYTDAENVALEFAVGTDGMLTMTSMGQIPNGRTYNIVFWYLVE